MSSASPQAKTGHAGSDELEDGRLNDMRMLRSVRGRDLWLMMSQNAMAQREDDSVSKIPNVEHGRRSELDWGWFYGNHMTLLRHSADRQISSFNTDY